jgi:hypothetical protein
MTLHVTLQIHLTASRSTLLVISLETCMVALKLGRVWLLYWTRMTKRMAMYACYLFPCTKFPFYNFLIQLL